MLERNVRIEEVDYEGKTLYAKKGTKLKTAVRLFCGECMGMCRTEKKMVYPIEEIKACTDKMCPLYEWRLGLNPYKSKSRVETGKRLAQGRQAVAARK